MFINIFLVVYTLFVRYNRPYFVIRVKDSALLNVTLYFLFGKIFMKGIYIIPNNTERMI